MFQLNDEFARHYLLVGDHLVAPQHRRRRHIVGVKPSPRKEPPHSLRSITKQSMASPIQFIGPSLAVPLVGAGRQYHRARPGPPLGARDLSRRLNSTAPSIGIPG